MHLCSDLGGVSVILALGSTHPAQLLAVSSLSPHPAHLPLSSLLCSARTPAPQLFSGRLFARLTKTFFSPSNLAFDVFQCLSSFNFITYLLSLCSASWLFVYNLTVLCRSLVPHTVRPPVPSFLAATLPSEAVVLLGILRVRDSSASYKHSRENFNWRVNKVESPNRGSKKAKIWNQLFSSESWLSL